MARLLHSNPSDGERGGATLELAIIAPTFILFIVGMVDVGRILMHHLVLTQIAYEGVRIAATTSDLEPPDTSGGACCTTTTIYREINRLPPNDSTYTGTCNTSAPRQTLVHNRLRTLFNIHTSERDLQLLEEATPSTAFTSFETAYPWRAGGCGGATAQDVRVRLCAFYQGLFPAFTNRIRICAEAVGPYLER